MIGADFEGGLTLDHRFLSESGRANIASDFTNLGPNLKTMREAADKSPFKIGAILNAPNTLLEGAIYTFTEKKNDPEGSQFITLKIEDGKLTKATNENGEVITTTDPTKTKNYAVNGIDTGFESAVENYFEKNGNPTELTLRHNPTHGPLGDLVESGLGKIADWTGLENTIAMNRMVAEDMLDSPS
jgi:major membrane immunogen (membrane-anchored lipoprotein)